MTDAKRIANIRAEHKDCSGKRMEIGDDKPHNVRPCPECFFLARIDTLEDFIANERSRDQIELRNLKARFND